MTTPFSRFVLYMTMALMDCVSGIFIFIGPVRATILGYDPLIAGSMVTARAVTCCLTSFIISRFLHSRNAVRFLFVSTGLYFCTALLGLLADNVAMLYVTSALAGVFMVVFSASFQVFMKDVDSGSGRPLSRVVGVYTLAWCLGMSFGPFITGSLMELGRPASGDGPSTGWMYAYLAAAGLIFMTGCGLLWIRKITAAHLLRRLDGTAGVVDLSEGRRHPDLAWLGWMMAIVGSAALGVVRAVFPAGITRAGMAEWQSGLLMTLVAVFMGLFAYVVSRGRSWMYSGRIMLGIGCIGVLGLSLYSLPWLMGWGALEHVWQFYAASVLAGSYSGIVYLYSGYHSLAHPEKAGRNISLNETFLALGMTTGTLGGGWAAKNFGFSPPFLMAAALALCLAVFQFFAHGGFRRRAEERDGPGIS